MTIGFVFGLGLFVKQCPGRPNVTTNVIGKGSSPTSENKRWLGDRQHVKARAHPFLSSRGMKTPPLQIKSVQSPRRQKQIPSSLTPQKSASQTSSHLKSSSNSRPGWRENFFNTKSLALERNKNKKNATTTTTKTSRNSTKLSTPSISSKLSNSAMLLRTNKSQPSHP